MRIFTELAHDYIFGELGIDIIAASRRSLDPTEFHAVKTIAWQEKLAR